jgi:hypothetical protein
MKGPKGAELLKRGVSSLCPMVKDFWIYEWWTGTPKKLAYLRFAD